MKRLICKFFHRLARVMYAGGCEYECSLCGCRWKVPWANDFVTRDADPKSNREKVRAAIA